MSAARDEQSRVVVTGMGLVSPYGLGVERFLAGVRAGEPAIRPIEDFDVSGCRCRSGARIPAFDPAAFDPAGTFRRAPRATQVFTLAVDEALRAAGASQASWDQERVGVFLGSFRAMSEVSEHCWHKVVTSEPRFVPALLFQETVTNAAASAVSIRFGFRGSNYAISSGNGSGFHVLHLAVQALRSGRADAIVAGTFDLFTEANQWDADAVGLLSASDACRPFDRRRDGFVMGEGAGALVLETLRAARARGARVLAEVTGTGLGHDAHGFSSLHPEGRGLQAAARQALLAAALLPEQIDYVAAAANSTPALDLAESRALASVFGPRAASVPVSALKGLTGEAMSASDLFSLVAAVGALDDGRPPSQAGTEELDPECPLNLIQKGAPARPVRSVLAHSYSCFGGAAAAVVVEALAA